MAVSLKPQAPKPTGPLAANTTCVTAECHGKFLTAPQIHGPVGEKACNACHEDDAGNHHYPLKRGGGVQSCTFCHNNKANSMAFQHAPLKDKGGCITCHDPHVSQTKFLLKADNTEQLCQKCHNVPLKKFAHEPFAQGKCTLCHDPHQSQNSRFLRGGPGRDHCFTCHGPMKAQLASSTTVHKPVETNCVICHNPHSTDQPHQLKTTVLNTCVGNCHSPMAQKVANSSVKHEAATAGAACVACHNPHASNDRHLLANRQDTLCMKCHDKPVTTPDGRSIKSMKPVLASQFLHGPVKQGECSACHEPHGTNRNDLLKRPFPETFYTRFAIEKYDLCFTCHEQSVVQQKKTVTLTNFRNGDVNLHFVHVNRDEKGRSCKTCHDLHGSNLPNHIADAVSFEGSRWAMPIEYRKTAAGGSCTPGCHDTKTYNRGSAPAVAPASRAPRADAAGGAKQVTPTTRGAS
jgi:predicted CXXCH cytochrome family protein